MQNFELMSSMHAEISALTAPNELRFDSDEEGPSPLVRAAYAVTHALLAVRPGRLHRCGTPDRRSRHIPVWLCCLTTAPFQPGHARCSAAEWPQPLLPQCADSLQR